MSKWHTRGHNMEVLRYVFASNQAESRERDSASRENCSSLQPGDDQYHWSAEFLPGSKSHSQAESVFFQEMK
jgi:hypothetical protein